MEGVGLPEKAKTNQKNLEKWTINDKNASNMKMEASDGRAKELGSTIGGRRASWEKPVAGGSLTRLHAPPMCQRVGVSCRRRTCA